MLEEIETVLGLNAAGALRYADRKRGQRRSALLTRGPQQTTLDAILLAGDTRAEAWIRTLLQEELPAQDYGRLLLLPGTAAPAALAPRGRQVCACFNVSEDAIVAQLARCTGSEGERLAALQQRLQCGTSCGSCVPELQRLARRTQPQQQAA